jgi:uncharacterized RDD family membrane protein YckC
MVAALILVSLAFHVNLIVLGTDMADQVGSVALAALIIVSFLIYWGYFFFFELWMNGRTPGKKSLKIRVVRLEGGPITFDSIAVRNLLRAVDFLGLYSVAGIAMFLTKKSQRLGDLAAGTVVISEDVPDYAAKADKKQKVLDDVAVSGVALAASRLTPQEYRLLHNYWLRREQLTLDARHRLLPQVMGPILTRLGEPVPVDSPAVLEAKLESLILQRAPTRRDEVGLPPQDERPQAPEENA